jgi:hypothetical protein
MKNVYWSLDLLLKQERARVSGKAEDTMRNNDAEGSRIPVVPVSEGSLIHTPGNPFCYDETCGCHEDPELIAEVTDAVNQGY